MKKTFLKELEVDAKKGNKMVERSLRYDFIVQFSNNLLYRSILSRFYEALVEADRLRSSKGRKGKGKPDSSGKS